MPNRRFVKRRPAQPALERLMRSAPAVLSTAGEMLMLKWQVLSVAEAQQETPGMNESRWSEPNL